MATDSNKPTIALGAKFEFGAVDGILGKPPAGLAPSDLGPLAAMVGSWQGSGFNTIFRPHNANSPNTLPVAVPGDNILELNLTSEHITFSPIAGTIPNRGFAQPDVALAGLTYLQQITDVTSQPNVGIHIEPGIWVTIPPTAVPGQAATVARMASIPHGTTINAQGTAKTAAGAPVIPTVDITPTPIGGGAKVRFPSQTASDAKTARIPQNLTGVNITQPMLDDPNVVLRNAIAGQTIVSTTELTISTAGVLVDPTSGGDTNIAFLGPNAKAVQMTATFWIETVEKKITIPPHKPGNPPVRVPLEPAMPGHPLRRLLVEPGREVTAPTDVIVRFTQIQYSQTVFLNFNGLSWPHVSVATLTPSDAVTVPPAAWPA